MKRVHTIFIIIIFFVENKGPAKWEWKSEKELQRKYHRGTVSIKP